MEQKDFLILMQNLSNRATEIELHNARIENRLVDISKIETALDGMMAIVRKKIVEFNSKRSK